MCVLYRSYNPYFTPPKPMRWHYAEAAQRYRNWHDPYYLASEQAKVSMIPDVSRGAEARAEFWSHLLPLG